MTRGLLLSADRVGRGDTGPDGGVPARRTGPVRFGNIISRTSRPYPLFSAIKRPDSPSSATSTAYPAHCRRPSATFCARRFSSSTTNALIHPPPHSWNPNGLAKVTLTAQDFAHSSKYIATLFYSGGMAPARFRL